MLAKPFLDWNQSGSYSLGLTSGTISAGLAGGSEIFQFRWTDTTKLAAIRNVRLSAGNTATAFTAGVCVFDIAGASAWTVDGTSGTAVVFGNNDQKRRTAYQTTAAPTNLGVRISSTGALGAGTKTLHTNALGTVVTGVPAVAGTGILSPGTVLFGYDITSDFPIVLAANEGFVIRATVPATGTWIFGVSIDWTEGLLTSM